MSEWVLHALSHFNRKEKKVTVRLGQAVVTVDDWMKVKFSDDLQISIVKEDDVWNLVAVQ